VSPNSPLRKVRLRPCDSLSACRLRLSSPPCKLRKERDESPERPLSERSLLDGLLRKERWTSDEPRLRERPLSLLNERAERPLSLPRLKERLPLSPLKDRMERPLSPPLKDRMERPLSPPLKDRIERLLPPSPRLKERELPPPPLNERELPPPPPPRLKERPPPPPPPPRSPPPLKERPPPPRSPPPRSPPPRPRSPRCAKESPAVSAAISTAPRTERVTKLLKPMAIMPPDSAARIRSAATSNFVTLVPGRTARDLHCRGAAAQNSCSAAACRFLGQVRPPATMPNRCRSLVSVVKWLR
jgi:hypothetical protein